MDDTGPLGLSWRSLFEAVSRHAPVRVGIVDADGRFQLSTTSPQVVGQRVHDLLPGHPMLEPLAAVLRGQTRRWLDVVGDGTYEIVGSPIEAPDGSVRGALLVGTLVTERVLAERRLVESEARLRHIVDSNMLPMMFWDETGLITDANDAFLELMGYDREALRRGDITWSAVQQPGHEAADAQALQEIEACGTITPYEKTLRHRDGAAIPVLVGGSRFERHRSAGVAFMVDLSERQRRDRERDELQLKLLQVQKLESLGLLAGGIAHDFNNLLTAILGGAATALLSLPEENPAHTDIHHVMNAARRAAELTRQLLAYSGKGHFQIKPMDLSIMVRELAMLLETTLPKKVQLRLELAAGLPAIEADAAQLQQVVMNLVINGAEAIGDSTGTVLVTSGIQDIDAAYSGEVFAAEQLSPGCYVYLEVHDTGCGMDDATRSKIFDPFFSTKFTGRGLGLAAVLGIVRAHKGAVRVYSTPGRGTTFKVLLPSTEARPAPRAPAPAPFHGSGLVLVIDDDDAVRRAARRMLTHFGFSVLEAENGEEGVAVFRNRAQDIALVLLDMTMPVMDGEEAYRELRAIRADVPVLLTSGYNEIEATRRFVSKGLTGFVQKPFTPEDLGSKLAALLAST